MIAPRYINTSLYEQESIEQSKLIHQQKLQKIRTQGSGLYNFNPIEAPSFPHLKNRWKSSNTGKSYSVKSESITKQNLRILSKIINITTSKSSSSRQSFWKKSLNLEDRLKEAKRIQQENKNFAQRIASQKPDYITKEIKKEYKTFLKFKDRLSRVNVLKSRKTRSFRKLVWSENAKQQAGVRVYCKTNSPSLKINEDSRASLREKTF